jgi:predicted dehydrogenase
MGRALSVAATKPRLGFLGVGRIGRRRMEAVVESGVADAAAIADPAIQSSLNSLDELLEQGVDGVVIATPSGLHAEQAIRALQSGMAVFCQKPLGRTAAEAQRVVDAARAADRLLEVDLSYRFTRAAEALRASVSELGPVYAAEAAFHNAYGPGEPWFYDPLLAGGGCVIDLGVHLVDLVLWTLGWPEVDHVESRLLHHGRHEVEDFALVRLDLSTGTAVSLACSWNLPAGRDCVIETSLYGTRGGATLHNVNGSFYDLQLDRYVGTLADTVVKPPDAWPGRAICDWAQRLGAGERFSPAIDRAVQVARILDRIYEAAA